MNKIIDERQQLVLKQVEYYLSDNNLSRDQFFHQKISETVEVLNTLIIKHNQ